MPEGVEGGLKIFACVGWSFGQCDQMPNRVTFGVGRNVIFFVNLFLYFNVDDLAYQVQYPLSIVKGSEGLLDERTMDGMINDATKSGNVVEFIDEAEGQPIPAYKHNCVREVRSGFFNEAFIWPTWVEAWLQWTLRIILIWRSCWS